VYSYVEDDTVEDPLLAQHLAHFGIDFSSLKKVQLLYILEEPTIAINIPTIAHGTRFN
jgi:hypothetical protein